jgi:hypothetical protein
VRWQRRGPRTWQNAPVVDRVVSHVTITDPRHSLFGQRLVVIGERSGRGPGYVAVELPGGRRRSVLKTATDLVVPSQPVGSNLPRISLRTLIPLARHVNRILNLLIEEVIRDGLAPPSASSRCVSTAEPGHQEQSASGSQSTSLAGPVARETNTDRPDTGGPFAPDAAGGRPAGDGDAPC